MALAFQGVCVAGGGSNVGSVVLTVSEDALSGELIVIFVAHDQLGETPSINLDCTLLTQIEVAGFAVAVFYAVLTGTLSAGFSELIIDVPGPNADIAVLAVHANGVTDGVTAGYRTGTGLGTDPATSSHSPGEDTLYFCGIGRDGGAAEFTPGSGWTDVGIESNAGGLSPRLDVEYQSANSGTVAGEATLSASQNWAALMAYFTANSGAGANPSGAAGNFLMLF